MTPPDEVRAAFEREAGFLKYDLSYTDESYDDNDTACAFQLYQSAYASGSAARRDAIVNDLRTDQAKFDIYNGPGMAFASVYVGELIERINGVSPKGEKGSNSETVWGGS